MTIAVGIADTDSGKAPEGPHPSGLAKAIAAWSERARQRVSVTPAGMRTVETGRVHSAGDGIAFVTGLRGVRLNELLHLPGHRLGYAAMLDEDGVHVVLLDDVEAVCAGQLLGRSGTTLSVPVGPELLGRVVDPLGRPLDRGAPVAARTRLPVERPAPTIVERALVREQVHTGCLVIDALFPLGRGQRELIIGDRGTGKTSIAVDALVAQRDSDLVCVYVAVGQKSESTTAVIDAVRRHGAAERTLFVVAAPTDAPGLRWLAPFSGFSMAEYFRDRGRHALVVIDDLSCHAATHRELALLMHQPPGREAYPGDIFHVHARLLERAARLEQAAGGGSLTALPIAQTEAGQLSAYIPTNLISITDGQIVLDSRLFELGQWPAVDTRLSVSRVGAKAQTRAMREAVNSLRLDYAQFLELEAFTRFGSELDARVQRQIDRGRRIRAMLAQRRLALQSASLQLAQVLALQAGLLDTTAPGAVPQAIQALSEGLRSPGGQALARRLESTGPIDNTVHSALEALLAPIRTAN